MWWSEAHGLCWVTTACQAEPRGSGRPLRPGASRSSPAKSGCGPGARALPSHHRPRSRSALRGPMEAVPQPLTQVAMPRCPGGVREEEGTFQSRCRAARQRGWPCIPGTSGCTGAGVRSLLPAARSLQEAANRPLPSDARRATRRESPDHSDPGPAPALPCARAILPCPLAEEQDPWTLI